MADLPEHVATNRAFWDVLADKFVDSGRRNWESEEPLWGIFSVPESEVGLLPEEIEGRDAIELGCGTGYVSAWLARRGAGPVAIDNSARQLETARAFQQEFGIDFPLLHGDAEHVPYPDASFDLAISEYGASIWCDPYAWIPEAARLLRPGGELSSSPARSSRSSAAPTTRRSRPATRSCALSSACTGSNGPARTRSNSTCPQAR